VGPVRTVFDSGLGPRLGPRFRGIRLVFPGAGNRAAPAMSSVEPEMFCSNRPPPHSRPELCSSTPRQERSVSSEQKRRPSRPENGEAAVRRRQVLGAGVSSSTTRSR
jgi:hypothetical protein